MQKIGQQLDKDKLQLILEQEDVTYFFKKSMLICFFRSFNGFDHKKQLTPELFKNVKKILTVIKNRNQLIKYLQLKSNSRKDFSTEPVDSTGWNWATLEYWQ